MGKRSDFERIGKDFYPTPKEAVVPLLKFLKPNTKFTEPCVGQHHLKIILEEFGHICVDYFDDEEDARITSRCFGEYYITNPPWDRKLLHPIIQNLSSKLPTWLLFDADWVHTKQSIPYIKNLTKIVSVGRVKWFPESKMTGKDNCSWYLFEPNLTNNEIIFYGRN